MARQQEAYPDVPVPIFLLLLRDTILDIGVTEGIFRISGHQVEVARYSEAFDAGVLCVQPGVNVHTLCSLLKLFLRELPSPVIPTDTYSTFLKPAFMSTIAAATVETEVLRRMPRANSSVLLFIIHFIRLLATFSSTTLMGAENLTLIFAPCLIRSQISNPSEILQYCNAERQFMGALIAVTPDSLLAPVAAAVPRTRPPRAVDPGGQPVAQPGGQPAYDGTGFDRSEDVTPILGDIDAAAGAPATPPPAAPTPPVIVVSPSSVGSFVVHRGKTAEEPKASLPATDVGNAAVTSGGGDVSPDESPVMKLPTTKGPAGHRRRRSALGIFSRPKANLETMTLPRCRSRDDMPDLRMALAMKQDEELLASSSEEDRRERPEGEFRACGALPPLPPVGGEIAGAQQHARIMKSLSFSSLMPESALCERQRSSSGDFKKKSKLNRKQMCVDTIPFRLSTAPSYAASAATVQDKEKEGKEADEGKKEVMLQESKEKKEKENDIDKDKSKEKEKDSEASEKQCTAVEEKKRQDKGKADMEKEKGATIKDKNNEVEKSVVDADDECCDDEATQRQKLQRCAEHLSRKVAAMRGGVAAARPLHPQQFVHAFIVLSINKRALDAHLVKWRSDAALYSAFLATVGVVPTPASAPAALDPPPHDVSAGDMARLFRRFDREAEAASLLLRYFGFLLVQQQHQQHQPARLKALARAMHAIRKKWAKPTADAVSQADVANLVQVAAQLAADLSHRLDQASPAGEAASALGKLVNKAEAFLGHYGLTAPAGEAGHAAVLCGAAQALVAAIASHGGEGVLPLVFFVQLQNICERACRSL
eukprot:TRINITY_DN4860_c0_g1_i1.p1 TRINITY_DN4860_c0_g1~~TRINITY_DN4860_c0_g1_i1.p1  ORF type:complete len:822 (-),score=221.02 TRINITY_DN4860_c0_g1_i1:40-2505(-)